MKPIDRRAEFATYNAGVRRARRDYYERKAGVADQCTACGNPREERQCERCNSVMWTLERRAKARAAR